MIQCVVRTLRILVKKPREGVSDSNILLELAILGKERIRNVHCVFRSFNPSEYIEKLVSEYTVLSIYFDSS